MTHTVELFCQPYFFCRVYHQYHQRY